MSKAKEQISNYEIIYKDIINKMHHKKYFFLDDASFMNTLLNDISQANKIYWNEILLRAHFASVVSIMRNEKWLKGISISIETENFLLFAASLRGFLESVTDSYYSLLNTPFDIARNYKNIKLALSGKLYNDFIADKLEESLIHFQHASKSKKSNLSFNNPLPATKYIKLFDKYGDTDTKELYSELCEVVHPAENSTSCFTFLVSESENFKYATTSTTLDSQYINEMLNKHNNVINKLLRISISAPVLCLKVLNSFQYELVASNYLNECIINDLISENTWNNISELIKLSYES